MSYADIQYKKILNALLIEADRHRLRGDRTGTGTYSKFGEHLQFDLKKGFPLLTTKKVHWPSVVHELIWFLSGDTNTRYLKENGVTIWDEWANEEGDLGPVYGEQWRKWWNTPKNIDQIAILMRGLRDDPYSRRHIVSAWNVTDLPLPGVAPHEQPKWGRMALAPCHAFWQVYISHVDDSVSLHLYQRSADYFLGVPFNIASYALLTHMIAHQLERPAGTLVISFGDVHLYANHVEQAMEQLGRSSGKYAAPVLKFKDKPDNLWDYKFDDIGLVGYEAFPAIKAPISI